MRAKRILRHDAIIVDDIGDRAAKPSADASALYISGRSLRTRQWPFSKWEQFFKDPMVIAAAIDRRVHHRVILALNIERYRMKVAKKNTSKKPDDPSKGSK